MFHRSQLNSNIVHQRGVESTPLPVIESQQSLAEIGLTLFDMG